MNANPMQVFKAEAPEAAEAERLSLGRRNQGLLRPLREEGWLPLSFRPRVSTRPFPFFRPAMALC
jgi:hypothetical protein